MSPCQGPDVVVVGAGPVGLTLALLLARRGRSVSVFDRWPDPFPLPRAVAMSHETTRTFQAAGVLDLLREHIGVAEVPIAAGFFTREGETLLRQEFPGLGESGFPPMTNFNQPDVDGVLNEACRADPLISLNRGWEARAIKQTGDGVRVTFDPVDGEAPRAGEALQVEARFVVGCDGANSFVRGAMSVGITDTGFSSTWLVVDILPTPELFAQIPFGQSLDPARPTTLVPAGRGRRRFEFILLPDEDEADIVRPERVWELIAPWGATPDNAELVRAATYTFRGRWAADWREGRVLVAGDAAHQMPPFMGQGFNSGIRDSAALAWRLDLVLAGLAPIELLDSYTSERLPHVRSIVEQSVAFGTMICILDPEVAAQRDAMLRAQRDGLAPAPPPPPLWRIGPGVLATEDPHAGFLGLQATVERDGKRALLDDLIGGGQWCLLGNALDPAGHLDADARKVWLMLDGKSCAIGPSCEFGDVDGLYAAWFARLDAAAVLVRPDFQVFGVARRIEDIAGLVCEAADRIGLARPGVARSATGAARGTAAAAPVPVWDGDLFAPDVLADSRAAHREIRDLGPVVWLARHDMYACGRFKDVQAGLAAHDALISGKGVSANALVPDGLAGVLTADGDRHAGLKRLLLRPLLPGALKVLKERLEAEAKAVVEDVADGREIEAMATLASHLPTRVVSDLVGLKVGSAQMLRWSGAGFQGFGPLGSPLTVAALPALGELAPFILGLTGDQVRPGSWAADLFAAADRGEITIDVARAMVTDYTLPSLDTTILATGELLWQIATTPGAFAALRADPKRVSAAVYEAVRLATPIRGFTRFAPSGVELAGTTLPAGSRIWLLNAAGNRDERHYPDPDRFDLDRNPRDNLGWGYGKHLCAGMHLARLEMETLLSAILRHVGRIEAGEPMRLVNNGAQGFAALPLTLWPA